MSGQLWVTNSLGGFMSSQNLSKVLRNAVQPTVKFRQFCDARDASMNTKKQGDTFHWDIFSDVSTQGTVVVETNTLPETNFTITQGTLTVTEYGNSVPFTQKLDNLSELPVREIINKVLVNDAKKTFDFAAHAQFNATLLRVAPTGGTSTTALTLTTNGTSTTTNAVALTKEHVKLIVDLMKERTIPPYINDDYVSIARPSTYRRLKNDMEALHIYVDQGFQMVMNGEIGRYESTRFVEQTNVLKGTANNGTAWTGAGASDWAYFFGADTVTEAINTPEEMRGKIPGDYGRSRGVAWYYMGGFGIAHPELQGSRIVKWDSQA